MLKAYINEFRAIFKQSKFHIVRYIGILFIPFLYGFFYIFAFWNPFSHINNIPVAIVTQKDEKSYDHFSEALGSSLKENQKINMGDIEVNFKAQHIYADVSTEKKYNDFIKSNKDKYHAIIAIPHLDSEFEKIIKTYNKNNNLDFLKNLISLSSKLSSDNKIRVFNNYKKNYIISFGLAIGNKSSSKNGLIIKLFSDVFNNKKYVQYLKTKNISDQTITDINKTLDNFKKIFNSEDSFKLIHLKTQMSKYAKYGFGLAPFFISIAIWVGLMAATFVINPRIYDQEQKAYKNYLAKYFALVTTSILQTSILLLTFFAIGFYQLSTTNLLLIFSSMVFGSFIFASVIQCIRWMAPNKLVGILFIIILLILQMASNGGLFPIELQSTFYQVLNIGLPASKLVTMIRESMFDFNSLEFFKQFGILLIYPYIFIPLGLLVNKHKTPKFKMQSLELGNDFLMKRGEYD